MQCDDARYRSERVVFQWPATVLVAGSAIFGERDGVTAAMTRLKMIIDQGENEPTPAEPSAL